MHRRAALSSLASLILLPNSCWAQGTQGADASPFALVSKQLTEDECPGTDSVARASWETLQVHFFEALSLYYGPTAESRQLALEALLRGLEVLLENLNVAYQCPLSCAKHFRLAGEWSLALGQPYRARSLVQVGNVFKLRAMASWWNSLGPDAGTSNKKFEPRFHVEYTIAITQLHAALQVPNRPIQLWSAAKETPSQPPVIEVHSICTYRSDPTSNTGPDCPLPELSVPNHRAYSDRHGYRYVLHTELPLPDREAHYSKMLVIHEALRRQDEPPDWVFFIDCDAFFTNPTISLADVLTTYGVAGAHGPHFLVAEDPGGINTGTMLFRRSDWSVEFLGRVASNQLGIAWDQSMFFDEMLRPGLYRVSGQTDFRLPAEIALVHQAHLNAFVPPASRDWSAYEWQPNDFVRHFAGCPWQEEHCLRLMRETAPLAGNSGAGSNGASRSVL